jgi:hypothetical protein
MKHQWSSSGDSERQKACASLWTSCSRDVPSHSGEAIRDGIRRPWPAATPAVIDEQPSIWLQERLQICQAQ